MIQETWKGLFHQGKRRSDLKTHPIYQDLGFYLWEKYGQQLDKR